MNTNLPGFQSFFQVFAYFCIGQISHQQHKGKYIFFARKDFFFQIFRGNLFFQLSETDFGRCINSNIFGTSKILTRMLSSCFISENYLWLVKV